MTNFKTLPPPFRADGINVGSLSQFIKQKRCHFLEANKIWLAWEFSKKNVISVILIFVPNSSKNNKVYFRLIPPFSNAALLKCTIHCQYPFPTKHKFFLKFSNILESIGRPRFLPLGIQSLKFVIQVTL